MVKTKLIPYCKPSGSSCTPVDSFDVQYKENTCPQKPPNQWIDTDNKCSNDPSTTPLVINVYYPSNHDYSACPLPAVILFHAGGYTECSSYTNAGIVAISQGLASRGFVVFDVNYRVGVIADPSPVMPVGVPSFITYTAAQQWLAIYRGLQDARGAIRSIIKMSEHHIYDGSYKIDENKIFLAGASAGSVLSLAAAYYGNQSKIDTVFPNVSSSLGSIDPDNVYYANTSDLSFDYHTKIIGVLNCWGSLVIPAIAGYFNDPHSFFSSQGYTLPPIISFQGKLDSTFNFKYQGVYFAPSGTGLYGINYHQENRCLVNSYVAPLPIVIHKNPIPNLILIGSKTIYEMLTNNASHIYIPSELYLDCQMAHGLDCDYTDPGCTIPFQSDFGTGLTNDAAVYDYICGRAATFFSLLWVILQIC
ncbi:MAG: alpha/beta hydrolase [Parafilimonas sp.]